MRGEEGLRWWAPHGASCWLPHPRGQVLPCKGCASPAVRGVPGAVRTGQPGNPRVGAKAFRESNGASVMITLDHSIIGGSPRKMRTHGLFHHRPSFENANVLQHDG